MSINQLDTMSKKSKRPIMALLFWCMSLFFLLTNPVRAGDLAITSLDFSSQPGDKLQIEMTMSGSAIEPKIFHTDNPARIALDFPGVKNGLDKKTFPINQGVASSLFVAEANERVRIVVNLLESVPYQTSINGNKVLLTLSGKQSTPALLENSAEQQKMEPFVISAAIPEQAIKGLDFKRGENGEGRILVSLANPNTVVNSREEGGGVVISFLNTTLPNHLSKRVDVSEFATPVRFIDASASSKETTIAVSMQNNLYDYSLFQSDGLLTVEFRPLTQAEKDVIETQRVKYSGDRLSLNFQEIDIRSVIAVLAEFTGQNLVAGDDVTGKVTLKLDDVPWDEALDFIMMTKGLEKYQTGNVTLIAPVGNIKDYKQKQKETEAVVEKLDPLITEYLKINYARAENFRNLLNGKDAGMFGSSSGTCGTATSKKGGGGNSSASGQAFSQKDQQQTSSFQAGIMGAAANGFSIDQTRQMENDTLSMLSPRGTVMVDSRTNTLVVRETPKRLEEIKKLIRKLDVAVRQVMIESRIVIASNTYARELGVRFGVAKEAQIGHGKQFAVGGGFNDEAQGDGDATIDNKIPTDLLVDLAASNPYGALGMTLARGADYVLNLELSALQDEGKGEVLSNPRVMTTDRCKAVITQGTSLPYETQSGNGGTNIQFIDALLKLEVTPQITPSGSIIMDLDISRDEPNEQIIVKGQPAIDTNNVKTNVLVNDGETVVLGGIYKGTLGNTVNKVPFFADLPGVGFLFKRTVNQDDKSELLVFVTPKIVKEMLKDY